MANTGALQKSVASLEMLVLSTQCTSSQKIKAGIIIPLAMLSELWGENAAINEYGLLLKHCGGFCAQSAVVTGTPFPSLLPNLTCAPSPLFGIRSQWIEVGHGKHLYFDGRNRSFAIDAVFNKYCWEENGFKHKNFSIFMLGLLGGSSFLKGCAGSDTSLKAQQCCPVCP